MTHHQQIRQLLVKIAEKDDKEAFVSFFRYYHPRLVNFSQMFVPAYQDAEDVVSEVMIKLLRRRKTLHEIPHLEGYLYQAIKNQALNHQRKLKIRQIQHIQDIKEDFVSSNHVEPLELVLADELRDFITETVNAFPPRRKIIYKMIKDDGLKIKEAASLLGIAEKTVKKHLELAIKDLRKALIAHQSVPEVDVPVLQVTKNLAMVSSIVYFLYDLLLV